MQLIDVISDVIGLHKKISGDRTMNNAYSFRPLIIIASGLISSACIDFDAGSDSEQGTEIIELSNNQIAFSGYTYSDFSLAPIPSGPGYYNYQTILARYNPDSSFDSMLKGESGKASGRFLHDVVADSDCSQEHDSCGQEYTIAIAQQSSEKIIVAGNVKNHIDGSFHNDIFLFRYNTDGSYDSSFGIEGRVFSNPEDNSQYASDMLIQDDDKIIIAGSHNSDSLITRLNADGSIDNSFGTNGSTIVDILEDDYIKEVIQLSSGKILAVHVISGTTDNYFAISRYNADGTHDNSFGESSGYTLIPRGYSSHRDTQAHAIEQADEKIMVFSRRLLATSNLLITSLEADGTFNNSFGTNGILEPNFGSQLESSAFNIFQQTDGKILLAGAETQYTGNIDRQILVRFLADGNLDTSFGNNGMVAGADGYSSSVIQISSGKILVAGSNVTSDGDVMIINQYESNGDYDLRFQQ